MRPAGDHRGHHYLDKDQDGGKYSHGLNLQGQRDDREIMKTMPVTLQFVLIPSFFCPLRAVQGTCDAHHSCHLDNPWH